MVCLKQTISLQIFKRLSSTIFIWSILQYIVPNNTTKKPSKTFMMKFVDWVWQIDVEDQVQLLQEKNHQQHWKKIHQYEQRINELQEKILKQLKKLDKLAITNRT